jgi:hypothetical protein
MEQDQYTSRKVGVVKLRASAMLKPNMSPAEKDKGGDEKNDKVATPSATAGQNAKATSDNQSTTRKELVFMNKYLKPNQQPKRNWGCLSLIRLGDQGSDW